jgi:hypothetical protein
MPRCSAAAITRTATMRVISSTCRNRWPTSKRPMIWRISWPRPRGWQLQQYLRPYP